MKRNPGITERAEKILMYVIEEYISTAAPVSSGSVAANHPLGLSPATIRNVMASLEREGYLKRPHACAGRIPTDKSFRFYVDTLLEFEEPREKDKTLIISSCEGSLSTGVMMRHATKALSLITSCAGVALTPAENEFLIKEIKVLPVGCSSNVLVVIVYTSGSVHTKLVRAEGDSSDLDPEKVSNYLNSIASGLTLVALRDRVLLELKDERNLRNSLPHRSLKLGQRAIEDSAPPREEVYLEGRINIFDQPEFKEDIGRIKTLLNALEEKTLLIRILDESVKKEGGISIHIGSECNVREFEGLSFVAASCGKKGGTPGAIGIIGPVRMNYLRIIPLVDYAARFLGSAL